MPSSSTPNYKLNQWEADDRVQRTDFNADNTKIDAAIKAVDKRVDTLNSGKADKSAVTALQTKVNAKAEQSAVTALQNSLTALADGTGGRELKRVTLKKTTTSFSLDLSGVDWSQWTVVFVGIIPVLSGTTPVYADGSGYRHSEPTITVFYPLRTPSMPVIGTCLRINSDSVHNVVNTTYDKYTGMDYDCYGDDAFEPGTTAWAIGLR